MIFFAYFYEYLLARKNLFEDNWGEIFSYKCFSEEGNLDRTSI